MKTSGEGSAATDDLERMFDRTPVRSCTPSRRQNHDTFEQMFECVSGKDYLQPTDH